MRVRLGDFPHPLTEVQQRLVDECGSGEVIIFGDLPAEDDETAPSVPADFLRYLILGGCDSLPAKMPAKGLRVAGLRILGPLDLETETVARDVGLVDCHFDTAPLLRSAWLRSLFLNGSRLPGLVGDRLKADGGAFFRKVESRGEIRLLGACFGGDLDCSGATLSAADSGNALNADRMTTGGGADFRGAEVTGEIRLLGATLGGNLYCSGATLSAANSGNALSADRITADGNADFREANLAGTVRLPGARIGGDVVLDPTSWNAPGRVALNADRMTVTGLLSVEPAQRIEGFALLSAATATNFLDNVDKWPDGGRLSLDRFTFGAFVGNAPTDAKRRIDWLDSQPPRHLNEDFRPQPWEHCAKVLRETGHARAAREVLIAKESRQRRAQRDRVFSGKLHFLKPGARLLDGFLYMTVAYGHRPLQALWSLALLLVVGSFIFWAAAHEQAIKPNSAVVLINQDWTSCIGPRQVDCFEANAGASYPRFNPIVYSFDTLVPLVSLEMQTSWLPDDTRPGWGTIAGLYLWFHIGLGWLLSLLAVAGFSGLIKQDSRA